MPLFGFALSGAASILLTTSILDDKADTGSTGANIFLVIFTLASYWTFGLLSYHFKIIFMTEKELVVVSPVRFQYRKFEFEGIDDLTWKLLGIYRIGDFRQLNILTSSGYRTNISDFEFINYDSLEKWLIDRTDIKLNLKRKLDVELQQARGNRWTNILIIALLVFFFFKLAFNQRTRTDIDTGIQIAFAILTWRQVVRLIQYQRLINKSKKK